jgi:shikimate kinase
MTATFRTSNPGSAADPRLPHTILVGLPGAGKSTIGQAVAHKLERTFLDFDHEIERREGMSIAQIFGEKGEGYFREQERALTDELRQFGNMILAPGGGWVSNPQVVALLRSQSRIIYLRVRPETALSRLGADRSTRPLLMRPDALGELRRLLQARQAAYESADYALDTELLDLQAIIRKVADLALGKV